MLINRDCAEEYKWGDGCQGWRFVSREDLSIIQERMPPGTSEQRHHHSKSRQFFFILRGVARIELEGRSFALAAGDGLEIPPGAAHQIFNESREDLEFLLVSQPTTRGDRVLSPLV